MSEDGNDHHGINPVQWILLRGDPMWKDVQGLKQVIWTAFGGGAVIGTIATILASFVLDKLGFS